MLKDLLDEGSFRIVLFLSPVSSVYSLDDELVKLYADEHPFQVVPSKLSNFSRVSSDFVDFSQYRYCLKRLDLSWKRMEKLLSLLRNRLVLKF
jgi:hypothetical protein